MYTFHMIYYIPEANIPQFEKRMARLIRAAAKVGSRLEYTVDRGDFRDVRYLVAENGQEVYRFYRAFKITVDGDQPKFAGWSFIGTLEHTEEGNVLRLVPEATCPEHYRNVQPLCDHCKLKRLRKDTYLVKHDNGEFKQCGRNCLKDFLGHENPHFLAQLAETWISVRDLAELAEDYKWQDGTGGHYISKERHDLLSYLTLVACVVRVEGRFVTRKQSEEWNKPSTSWTAQRLMLPYTTPKHYENEGLDRYGAPTEADSKLATDALEWTRLQYGISLDTESDDPKAAIMAVLDGAERTELSDFDHNLFVVAKGESVERRTFGIAAYLIQNYRIKNNLIEKKVRPVSNYAGELGKRMRGIEIEVESIKSWESVYGWTSLFKLRDNNGNILVWITTGGSTMKEGEHHTVDATVKKHSEYHGEKQTAVSRLTVKSGPPVAQPAAPVEPVAQPLLVGAMQPRQWADDRGF